MNAAFQGVRVLDLTRLLPGAIASMMLADLGAEVIKIEDPQAGDYARRTPPFINGQGAFFMASNRNKHSVVIDLKQTDGQAVLHRLAESADVVMEGFRPGVTARLRADYATLSALNPRLIYASLSGWGADGPYAEASGHDLNYVALSGLLGGMAQAQPLGGQIADVGGAYLAVMGISAALFQRERTGQGAHLDIALFEASMPFAMYQWVEGVTAGLKGGAGSLTGGMAFYQVYACADGEKLAFAPIEPKFWANFCRAVERPEWIPLHTDPAQQDVLKSKIGALFATRSAEDWMNLLGPADCCVTRITPTEKLSDDPQVQARGMARIEADGVPVMRSPLRLGQTPPYEPAPQQGQHTRTILQMIGYSLEELEDLLARGIVGNA
ncbi:MAG: CaiB/BaiF CoA-transferase family protein [Anaerolineae bacterium]|nr:CaiB/BaiF CoA-transferase family protein [Anaerolineae bacterium]